MEFNKLEKAIFEWAENKYKDERLTAQLQAAILRERRWTKVGFFVYIDVPRTLEPIDIARIGSQVNTNKGVITRYEWPIEGPILESPGIEHGGGSVFFGKNGYLDNLEIYSFGDKFDENLDEFKFLEVGKKFSS